MPIRRTTVRQAASALRIARACDVPMAGAQPCGSKQKALAGGDRADIEAIRDAAEAARARFSRNRLLAVGAAFPELVGPEEADSPSSFPQQCEDGDTVMSRHEPPRARRLDPGEGDRLLAHAAPHLRSLIVAALYIGCRVGELLSLQWHQVRHDERGVPRSYPVPRSLRERRRRGRGARCLFKLRLRAELAMRRHAPDGQPHPPSAMLRKRGRRTDWQRQEGLGDCGAEVARSRRRMGQG